MLVSLRRIGGKWFTEYCRLIPLRHPSIPLFELEATSQQPYRKRPRYGGMAVRRYGTWSKNNLPLQNTETNDTAKTKISRKSTLQFEI